MGLGRIRVVLVRPRNSGNIGATARAIKNMGLGRLVLVAPHRFDPARARKMAVSATDVLDRHRAVSSVEEAVADCGLAIGTTSRSMAGGIKGQEPRVLAPEIVAASDVNDVALVFGPEHHGLSSEELRLCHCIASIPSSPTYPSLNLAQAVLLFAYELFLAERQVRAPGVRVLAVGERLELMYRKLEEALRRIGFLHPGNAEHMMRTLRRIMGRAELDEHDLRVFLGLARQISWAGSQGDEPTERTGAANPRVAGLPEPKSTAV